MRAIADPADVGDPAYAQGLRAAVSAAVEYGLASDPERPIPLELLAQARLAARSGVSLDTVMRRYGVGHSLLSDMLAGEAETSGLSVGGLKHALRAQSASFNRLLTAVGEEYRREETSRTKRGSKQRRAELVRSLLDGERVDAADLGYELNAAHLGAVATGDGAAEAIRRLAGALDRRLLLVSAGGDVAWAWLGGKRPLDPGAVERAMQAGRPANVALAIGEPGEGTAGWRLTHRQALAALPIAQCHPERLARYVDVALLASVIQDDLLAASLTQLFVRPIEADRDGGATAFETLRAYFAADCNAASAAASLGISRQAVNGRLRSVESRIGRLVSGCVAELELAVRLRDLEERRCDRTSAGERHGPRLSIATQGVLPNAS